MSILEDIKNINAWKNGDKRAPHKPLLILYALSKLQQGIIDNPYEVVDEQLSKLLEEFGPPNKTKATYPFIRLANDGIWEVNSTEHITTTEDYGKRKLIELHAVGRFKEEIVTDLRKPEVAHEVIEYLLDQNFPETLHEDLLNALGIDLSSKYDTRKSKRRDPHFRERVLEAYEHKCAVCGYQIRRGNQLVGVEAAHIKWHQAGGPDTEQNGLAMCSMHHKLYDYGLFAIDKEMKLRVSTKANGGYGLKEWLLDFHQKPLAQPSQRNHYPEPEFMEWQVNEVFKGSYRD